MKKFVKKIFKLVLILVIIFVIFLGYQYIKYLNTSKDEGIREDNAHIDVELEEKLLKDKLEAAKNMVTNINNDVALTVLRTSGKITLSHDKTPENNQWLEWLINSDIKVYAEYETAFTIETNLIKTSINEEDGTVTIAYDPDDIKLSFVDIKEISTSNNKSIFGSSYTPSQVAALENIAHDDIEKYTNSDANKRQASRNLEMYFSTMSYNYGVTIKVEEQ